jgi:hypothetical protein
MGYRIAEHLAGPKPLVEQLVAIAVEELTTKVTLRILKRVRLDATHLSALRDLAEKTWDRHRSPIDFSGERLICHTFIQMTFTDEGNGQGYVPRAVSRGMAYPPPCLKQLSTLLRHGDVAAWRDLRRDETVRLTDEVFAFLDSIRQRTPGDLRREGVDVGDAVSRMVENNVFLRVMIPAYARAYLLAYRARAARDSLPLAIAVKRYQLERGELPDDLDELVVAGYLPALPADPFSGASYVYRKQGGDFLLYSLGEDFDDDAGVRGRSVEGEWTGDLVFWPPED